MKNRYLSIIFAIIFLLNISVYAVHAVEEWHFNDDTWEYEGSIYHITVNEETYDVIVITVDDHNIILNLGECEEYNLYKYCFEDVASPDDTSHLMMDAHGILHRAVKINYYSLEPEIKVEHSLNVSSPVPGSTITLTIKVKNNGPLNVEDLTLEYDPSLNYSGHIELGPIYLGANRQYNKTFNITINSVNKFDIKGTLRYKVRDQIRTKAVKITISPKKLYSYEINSPISLKVREEKIFKVVIKNTGDKPLNYSLDINSHLVLLNKSHHFFKRGTINKSNNITFIFPVYSSVTGKGNINIQLQITTEFGTSTIEKSYSINVNDNLPTFSFYVSKDSIVKGDNLIVGIKINSRGVYDIKNLNLNTSYGCTISNKDFPSKDEAYKVCEQRITPEGKGKIKIFALGTYNYHNDIKTINISKEINIYELNESVRVEHQIEKKQDKYVVKTILYFLTDSGVLVNYIGDSVYGASLLHGKTHDYDITGIGSKKVYLYSISLPSKCSYIITKVNLTFKGQNQVGLFNYSLDKSQCKEKKQEEKNEKNNKSENENKAQQEQQQEKKKENKFIVLIKDMLKDLGKFFKTFLG